MQYCFISSKDFKVYILGIPSFVCPSISIVPPPTEYILSLDNDAGNFYKYGGDYIKILDYIEEHFPQIAFTINIHTANPVARNKMIKIKAQAINSYHLYWKGGF